MLFLNTHINIIKISKNLVKSCFNTTPKKCGRGVFLRTFLIGGVGVTHFKNKRNRQLNEFDFLHVFCFIRVRHLPIFVTKIHPVLSTRRWLHRWRDVGRCRDKHRSDRLRLFFFQWMVSPVSQRFSGKRRDN